MSYSLNSLKGGYIGGCIGDYYRAYCPCKVKRVGEVATEPETPEQTHSKQHRLSSSFFTEDCKVV